MAGCHFSSKHVWRSLCLTQTHTHSWIHHYHFLSCCSCCCFFLGGEPLDFMNWEMIQEFAMNFVESAALFGGVTAAMDFLLKRKWIFSFPG